ncbi:hypothetical protein [Nioella sp.]|jgi:hypothetical protein|uniref:hypothetical protein n=1 Tax=Nioella sp. TaxID=1912091 RepID=UPI003B520341
MLIGLEKRFVFIANTKTGSTSIEQALAQYADFQHVGTPKRKHIGIRDVLNEYQCVFSQPGSGPETFLKFGVMRDPVDWIVSWFRYRKREGEHQRLPIDMTLEEFWERRDWTFQKQGGVKNLQKTRFTSETGEVLMDRIIPFPELAPQFAAICDSLGIKIPLPKANVSKIRALDVPISVNLRRKIEQFFEEDYELYNRLDELNARPASDERQPCWPPSSTKMAGGRR